MKKLMTEDNLTAKERDNRRAKNLILGISLLLIVTLITSTTMAFREGKQEKLNFFISANQAMNVVLVENFNAPQYDWVANEPIDKQVFVKNGQKDDSNSYSFVDAYIRVKFNESLNIQNIQLEYSKDYYLIDENGDFVTYEVEKDAEHIIEDLRENYNIVLEKDEVQPAEDTDHDNSTYKVVKMSNFLDGDPYEYYEEKYFIKTSPAGSDSIEYQYHLAHNGIIGKQIVMGYSYDEQNSDLNSDDVLTNVVAWKDGKINKLETFNFETEWEFGEDVIHIDDWDEKPIGKWIITDDGWIYWGEPLKHRLNFDDTEEEKSKTSNLLESITATKIPNGSIDYVIGVEMEAVSIDELQSEEMEDWNSSVIDAWLNKTISDQED